MLTQTVAGRVWDYSHNVGRSSQSGIGFSFPTDMALGEGDVVYVLNRGSEAVSSVPWNRTGFGARVSIVTIGPTPGDEEFVGEFSRYGDGEGQLIWPVGIALDSRHNIYITDEWLNRVSIFDKDGSFLSQWGASGDGDGEFSGASGIAIDREDRVHIVDSRANRVQMFTLEGRFLGKWGTGGSGDGQLDAPWGLTVDHQGYVYVADHRNHRVQKFTPDGEFLVKFGSQGTGRAELTYPTDVAVDSDGDVYVCDWANDRVQAFGPDGRFLTTFKGDAQQLSKWGQMTVDANADVIKARRRVYTTEPEWGFSMPTAAVFDVDRERLMVVDTQRSRIQIYCKLKDYVEPQFNL